MEERAAIAKESKLGEPEDAVAGAAVEVGDVDEAVSGCGHEFDDFREGLFVLADNDGFHQKNVGFAEQAGGASEDLEVETFCVNLHHFGGRSAAGRDYFVQGFYGDGGLLRTGGLAVAIGEDEGAAIVAGRDTHRHCSGLIAGGGIDPVNFAAAIEEVPNMGLQVILRLDEGVVSAGKMLEGGAGPIAAVGADVEDMRGSKTESLEQREKGIEAFAGPGTVVDANKAVAEFFQDRLENTSHLRRELHVTL